MATGQTRSIGGIAPKKSTIPGKIPTGTTIGEIFSNLPDQKLWGYDGSIVFEYGSKSFLNLTGGTITGNTRITGNLSAGTFISGSTNLYSIFAPLGGEVTAVQPGSNITTGGTATVPIINLAASPSINNLTVSGTSKNNALSATTLSGGTILSGSTDLADIFQQKNGYLLQKNGIISGSTFSGTPKKATVTFTTAFTGSYSIAISAEVNRSWTIESKSSSGFTINANSSAAFVTSDVFWIANEVGEGYR